MAETKRQRVARLVQDMRAVNEEPQLPNSQTQEHTGYEPELPGSRAPGTQYGDMPARWDEIDSDVRPLVEPDPAGQSHIKEFERQHGKAGGFSGDAYGHAYWQTVPLHGHPGMKGIGLATNEEGDSESGREVVVPDANGIMHVYFREGMGPFGLYPSDYLGMGFDGFKHPKVHIKDVPKGLRSMVEQQFKVHENDGDLPRNTQDANQLWQFYGAHGEELKKRLPIDDEDDLTSDAPRNNPHTNLQIGS